MKLGQNACLDEILMSLKMGHVRSKPRSQGQILVQLGVHCRGHIFGPISMKLGQNVCLYEISEDFENRSCRVKN